MLCLKKSPSLWMHEALTVAQQALPLDVPVGAILVHEGRIIAQAYNRREIDQNPIAHAEILLLQAAAAHLKRWRLQDTTLYVTLEPCPMCASAIQQARVGQVIFGAYDPIMGACGSRWPFLMNSPDISVQGGILEERCRTDLQTFFRHTRQ